MLEVHASAQRRLRTPLNLLQVDGKKKCTDFSIAFAMAASEARHVTLRYLTRCLSVLMQTKVF